jgi:hypothetical protein
VVERSFESSQADVRNGVADPDSGEAEEQLAKGVERGGADLAAARKRKRIQAKRGERCKSAEKADHDECAPRFTDVNAGRGDEAGNDPDRETTHHVYQQEAQRKAGAEPHLNDVIGEVAEEGSDAASDGDRQ